MVIHRHSRSSVSRTLFILAAAFGIGIQLLCASAGAADNTPKRMAEAQPGDCTACHSGGGKVLPESHTSTKGMMLKDCMVCHGKDDVPLKSKMPVSHTHTLSGISCRTCHGKKEPFKKMNYKDCTSCHSTDTLAKAPARDHFLPNPHNSHYGTDVDCSLCHFQHKKSEFMCAQCHDFKNVTPSPMVPLKFMSKPDGGKAAEASGRPSEAKAPADCGKAGATASPAPGQQAK